MFAVTCLGLKESPGTEPTVPRLKWLISKEKAYFHSFTLSIDHKH